MPLAAKRSRAMRVAIAAVRVAVNAGEIFTSGPTRLRSTNAKTDTDSRFSVVGFMGLGLALIQTLAFALGKTILGFFDRRRSASARVRS